MSNPPIPPVVPRPDDEADDVRGDLEHPQDTQPAGLDDESTAGRSSIDADRDAAYGEDVDTQYEPETDSAAADEARAYEGERRADDA